MIKMIIKGRRPTMRDVSRTHRVTFDWLCDSINLDPKVQFKYMDTEDQLADTLTKNNFTRYEWNNLLHSFNICNFSSASCPKTLPKRVQEGSREERVTAKSEPMMTLVSKTEGKSSMSLSSSASNCPGHSKHKFKIWVLFRLQGDLRQKIQMRTLHRALMRMNPM